MKEMSPEHAPAEYFPGVGQLWVWGQKSPHRGTGIEPRGGLRAKPPEADDRL